MDDVLWLSFANVARAGVEASALLDALEQVLASSAAAPIDVSTYDESTQSSENEWVSTTVIMTYKLARSPLRPRATGTISVALSFWRKEDEGAENWVGARQAKLYVAYAPPARSPRWTVENLWVGGDGHSEHARATSPRRWAGAGGGVMASAWFFCVRLADLQTRDDLVREVAEPLGMLITGADEEVAFARCASTIPTPWLES